MAVPFMGVGGDGEHGSLVSMWTPNAFAIVVTLCQKSITLPVIDVQLSESREGTDRETVRVFGCYYEGSSD